MARMMTRLTRRDGMKLGAAMSSSARSIDRLPDRSIRIS
jgi:hypothetical protein